MSVEFKFTEINDNKAQEFLKKYPAEQKFSGVMPILTLAQKQNGGFLTEEIISYVSNYLNMSRMSVAEVANFYSMYNLKPVGENLIQVCNSVVCCVKGSEDLYSYAKEITGTTTSDISRDGLFSVKKVECLGACVNAIAIKINDTFIEEVTKEKLDAHVDNIKKGSSLNKKSIIRKTLVEK